MAHDEYEHQRRQTAAAYLAAMQDSVNRTFERIEMARRTGTVAPRHCGNRTLTGDHHMVCDCPEERFVNPPDDPACTTNRTEQQ